MLGNLVVWSMAAGMYRNESDKHGKSSDLWGWTCNAGAKAIQKEFVGEIGFDRFCDVQVSGDRVGGCDEGANVLAQCEPVYWSRAGRCLVVYHRYLYHDIDEEKKQEAS
jgi:hypothetical protein